VVIGSIVSNPGNAARGAALLVLGIPVYLYWNRQRMTRAASEKGT
jgi:basic amino acid/polyamine antiporter, APA family